jgi:hypothetical protein
MSEQKTNKTHYRRVFKSDHLGVADIEDLQENGSNLIFTITRVAQEFGVKVAGKKVDKNIAYFQEDIKPWCLNAGTCSILADMAGSKYVEDWGNRKVMLYIDPNAKYAGEVTGGVRINPKARFDKKEITPETVSMWKNAKSAYVRDGNFNAVLERAEISLDNQAKIIEECSPSDDA